MAWDSPSARLREMILGMRALWNCWQNGARLNFRGEYYKLTLMSPFFNPGPIEHPRIPIYIAGVNKGLCQLAGELCEGFHVPPFHTVKYLQEVTLPNIGIGLVRSGRQRSDISLSSSVFVITGQDAEALAAEIDTLGVGDRVHLLPAVPRREVPGLLDRVNYYVPFVPGQQDAHWRRVAGAFHQV